MCVRVCVRVWARARQVILALVSLSLPEILELSTAFTIGGNPPPLPPLPKTRTFAIGPHPHTATESPATLLAAHPPVDPRMPTRAQKRVGSAASRAAGRDAARTKAHKPRCERREP